MRDDLEPHFAGEYHVTDDSADFWDGPADFFADRGRLLNVDDMHSAHPPIDNNKGDTHGYT